MMQPSNALRVAVLTLTLPGQAALAMQPPPPAGTAAGASAPAWSKRMQLPDGRTFVSDGAIALDAAVAKPATLPSVQLPAATGANIGKMLDAPFTAEFRSAQLVTRGKHYATPDGVVLNRLYVDYLRRTVAAGRLSFRVNGPTAAVVAALDGRPVAVVMPMAQ
jgi:hypothetical protein